MAIYHHILLPHPCLSTIVISGYIFYKYKSAKSEKRQIIRSARIKHWRVGDILRTSKKWPLRHNTQYECELIEFRPSISGKLKDIDTIEIKIISDNPRIQEMPSLTVSVDDIEQNITSEKRESRNNLLKEILEK